MVDEKGFAVEVEVKVEEMVASGDKEVEVAEVKASNLGGTRVEVVAGGWGTREETSQGRI